MILTAVTNFGRVVMNFEDLPKVQQRGIIKIVKKQYKNNIVGSLFGDTKAVLYSFSLNEEWLELNPSVFDYLIRNMESVHKYIHGIWAGQMDNR